MKKLLLALFWLSSLSFANAQLGTAHDFTVTDINGIEFNLYNTLDEGKVVVLDVSATWCGPCWNLHQNHYLQDLHEMYGPDGTDQIRVIFYEGDANTGMDALTGTGGNTLGDWTEGVTYPIVNETPLQLNLGVYAPLGFPTVNIIRPSDREIVADVYNQNLQGMIDAINTIITLGTSNTEGTSIVEDEIIIGPNPAREMIQINLNSSKSDLDQVVILSGLGQEISTHQIAGQKQVELSLAGLQSGFYYLAFYHEGKQVRVEKLMKR